MASFSPGIEMGRGQEHKLDAHKKLLIALIISSSSLGLIILFCLCFWVYRSKKSPKTTNNSEDAESGISISKKGSVQSFDYKTLEKATCGFKDSNLIGRGGFGFVYKACLSNHTLAAVKRIENVSQEAKREFQKMVYIASVYGEWVRNDNLTWYFEVDYRKGGRMFSLRDGCTHDELIQMASDDYSVIKSVELSYPLPEAFTHSANVY